MGRIGTQFKTLSIAGIALLMIGGVAVSNAQEPAPWWAQGLGLLMRGVSEFSKETNAQNLNDSGAAIGLFVAVGVAALFGLGIIAERKRHDARMSKKDEMLTAKDTMLAEEHTATMEFIESSMKRVDAVTGALIDHTKQAGEREQRAKDRLDAVAKAAVKEIGRQHKAVFKDFAEKEIKPLNESLRVAVDGLNEAAAIIRERDMTLVDTVKNIVKAAVEAALTPLLAKEETKGNEDAKRPDTDKLIDDAIGAASAADAPGPRADAGADGGDNPQ
jgi:hypothetical protein